MKHATLHKEAVFDGLLRLIHAWNAVAILALIATGLTADAHEHSAEGAALWDLHIRFGYALIGGLCARLLWGLVGPVSARWSDMWHPRAWLAALSLQWPRARRGHDVLASAAFLALYVTLAAMAATGLALAAIEHNLGPLTTWLGDSVWLEDYFEEPHEALYGLVVGFVGIHVGALLWHQLFGPAPVAQAMITGNQYLNPEGETHA